MAELTDYSHQVVPRSCGGRHTVISASQRCASLQRMKHHSQPELNVTGCFYLVVLLFLRKGFQYFYTGLCQIIHCPLLCLCVCLCVCMCQSSEEVCLVGVDGKIYKGRLNPAETRNAETKLPPISTKDGKCIVFTFLLFIQHMKLNL